MAVWPQFWPHLVTDASYNRWAYLLKSLSRYLKMNGLLVTLQLWHFSIFPVLPPQNFNVSHFGALERVRRVANIFRAARNLILAPPWKRWTRKRVQTGQIWTRKGVQPGPKKGAPGGKKMVQPGPENMVQLGPEKGCTGVPPQITNGANAVPAEDPSASEVKFANFGLPLLSVAIFRFFVLTKYTF